MVWGGTGALVGLAGAAGMFWFVDQMNPYANKTAIVLAGLVLAIVGFVANRTELVWTARRDPNTGGFVRERHHVFWINVEWWGAAVVALGLFR